MGRSRGIVAADTDDHFGQYGNQLTLRGPKASPYIPSSPIPSRSEFVCR